MKYEEWFNDLTLSAISIVLIVLWLAVRQRTNPANPLFGEKTAATVLRMACGLLLTAASLDKVGDALVFSRIIKECYNVLPDPLIPLAAVIIPWFEFFTGLCLITGTKWRGAALVFTGLMLVYALTISWDLLHGIDCNCGCFKMDSKEKMTWWTVLRDAGFFGMGLIVLVSPDTYAALDRLNDQKDLD
jgi:putative oxidoreductase